MEVKIMARQDQLYRATWQDEDDHDSLDTSLNNNLTITVLQHWKAPQGEEKEVGRKHHANIQEWKERGVSWKQRPLRPLSPPKTPKLENKDPPSFSGLRNYDQSVANTTVISWALVTRILASRTDIRGIGFVLNRKTLCFVSSKELTPGLFEVFNFHRK